MEKWYWSATIFWLLKRNKTNPSLRGGTTRQSFLPFKTKKKPNIMNHNTQPEIITEGDSSSGKKYLLPFILVISLFFLWGMAHNLDSILIPHLKKACNLNNRQSTLIDTSVFFAYFIMAIPAGMILKKWGLRLNNKLSTRNDIMSYFVMHC